MPNDLGPPPYKIYRAGPRGLKARLRGEEDELQLQPEYHRYRSGRDRRRPSGRRITWKRVALGVVAAVVGWLLLSFVLFMISAESHSGGPLVAAAEPELSSGGPMLTSANTILILGLDNRPTTGPGSKEGGGANTNEADANTDTIMLWRVGGGVSRRLSIPRDTLVNIPGHGEAKINAAWAYGGPALALKVIKQFTGIQINHLVVIDLANFPKFIDDIGGVTVTTGKICSNISGGTADGGFTLDLNPGTHHLNGEQAMILARTRENSCNPASTDLTREAAQQQILNSIKSQLLTLHTFVHLPWAAWDAPSVFQTDMGGLTLMQMFAASEIGGSAPTSLLSETNSTYNGEDVLIPNQANVQAQVSKLLNG
ncbi:MAG TPA: LCP family protein [Solirubrobacteraceae bacterium]|nr:LCP family protein [Solirubrobacteraceae bacterium]